MACAVGRVAAQQQDDAVARASAAHLIVEPGSMPGLLTVTETWILVNDSDEVLSPGEHGIVRFALPSGAFQVQLDEATSSSAVLEGNLVIDRGEMAPGERQVVLRYSLPYAGAAATFDKVVGVATDELRVIVVAAGATVTAPPLGEPHPVTVGERQMVACEGRELRPGTVLRVRVAGLADAGDGPGAPEADLLPAPMRHVNGRILAVWGLAVGILGALAALAYPWWGGWVDKAGPTGAARTTRYRSAVERIARLDDRYASGGMTTASYERRRRDLLRTAMSLLDDERED